MLKNEATWINFSVLHERQPMTRPPDNTSHTLPLSGEEEPAENIPQTLVSTGSTDEKKPAPAEAPGPATVPPSTEASPPAPPRPEEPPGTELLEPPAKPGQSPRPTPAMDRTEFLEPGSAPDRTLDYQPQTVDEPPSTAVPGTIDRTIGGIGSPEIPGSRPFVPGYEIVSELGRGGMGVVYKARQVGLNRLVALKMILSGAHASKNELARFRAEAEAIAQLQHPNIVQVYEVGTCDGLPFFSLEFVEGGSLADKLVGEPMPPRLAAQLLELLARAMEAAHQHGVVHRDLKPANVLLGRKPTPEEIGAGALPLGAPKITDFGLAKNLKEQGSHTQSGSIMGTPNYMAPEQAKGLTREIGPLADVYALGAILYELLTGRPPFRGDSPWDTISQVINDDPLPPSTLRHGLPIDLETICLKCLRKEPAKRYSSAAALADDLRLFLDSK